MTYSTPVVKAKFLSRPNRFIALVELNGQAITVHVKNTGRCKELLPEGATVYLAAAENPARKTPYDLVAVEKVRPDGSVLFINMDSQAPNAIAAEYLPGSGLFDENTVFRREVTHGASRFDFAMDTPESPTAYLEVKGCTLEREGIAYFPDAPTERGVKHIKELIRARSEGFDAYIMFIIQMDSIKSFLPNEKTHPEFASILREADKAGVKILAYSCKITENDITVSEPVKIKL